MSNTTYYNALPLGSRLPGTQVDQYEVTAILGAGGFGITYKARDHLLDSDVAIKEYLPNDFAVRHRDGATVAPNSSADKENFDWGLERFLEEARTLSKFKQEPNIVRVENFVEANGTAYMVMQYEEGIPLDEYIKQNGVLNEAQLKALMIPILDSLRTLHSENYYHRDIKPANIYLRKNGVPILLDFGAARQSLSEHSRSVTSILTSGYAPIEQYSERGTLVPATDLYALGATMYRCITGNVPPSAPDRVAAFHNDEADPLRPINAKSAGYSQAFIDTVHWMLNPRLKDRPAHVDAVIARLTAEQVHLNPEPQASPAPKTHIDNRRPQPAANSQEPKKRFWKFFFWLLAVATVYEAISMFNPEIEYTWGEYGYALFSLYLTIAIFGYAYNKPIYDAKYWSIMFWLAIVCESIYLFSTILLMKKELIAEDPTITAQEMNFIIAFTLVVMLVLISIRWRGVYLYAYRSAGIWAKKGN